MILQLTAQKVLFHKHSGKPRTVQTTQNVQRTCKKNKLCEGVHQMGGAIHQWCCLNRPGHNYILFFWADKVMTLVALPLSTRAIRPKKSKRPFVCKSCVRTWLSTAYWSGFALCLGEPWLKSTRRPTNASCQTAKTKSKPIHGVPACQIHRFLPFLVVCSVLFWTYIVLHLCWISVQLYCEFMETIKDTAFVLKRCTQLWNFGFSHDFMTFSQVLDICCQFGVLV